MYPVNTISLSLYRRKMKKGKKVSERGKVKKQWELFSQCSLPQPPPKVFVSLPGEWMWIMPTFILWTEGRYSKHQFSQIFGCTLSYNIKNVCIYRSLMKLREKETPMKLQRISKVNGRSMMKESLLSGLFINYTLHLGWKLPFRKSPPGASLWPIGGGYRRSSFRGKTVLEEQEP